MPAIFDSPSRRTVLSLLAASGLASVIPSFAGDELIGKLIADSRQFPDISRRIEFISGALVGKRYKSNTLIGGPRSKEQFVLRDDAFDCVTYCEVVVAAAQARDLPSFEANLRAIRYKNGEVEWRERNHDFTVWYERNVANGIFRALTVGSTVEVRKTITVPPELGKRSYSIAATPRTVLLKHRDKLAVGDIMGFVSLRPGLDYYHCSFVVAGKDGGPMLRHASLSHGRVVNEKIETFFNVNKVRYVTLLRPQERAA